MAVVMETRPASRRKSDRLGTSHPFEAQAAPREGPSRTHGLARSQVTTPRLLRRRPVRCGSRDGGTIRTPIQSTDRALAGIRPRLLPFPCCAAASPGCCKLGARSQRRRARRGILRACADLSRQLEGVRRRLGRRTRAARQVCQVVLGCVQCSSPGARFIRNVGARSVACPAPFQLA